jgi:hypothetical protein
MIRTRAKYYLGQIVCHKKHPFRGVVFELLSNLVFEIFWSCRDLIVCGGFYSVGELYAYDDFGEIIEAA